MQKLLLLAGLSALVSYSCYDYNEKAEALEPAEGENSRQTMAALRADAESADRQIRQRSTSIQMAHFEMGPLMQAFRNSVSAAEGSGDAGYLTDANTDVLLLLEYATNGETAGALVAEKLRGLAATSMEAAELLPEINTVETRAAAQAILSLLENIEGPRVSATGSLGAMVTTLEDFVEADDGLPMAVDVASRLNGAVPNFDGAITSTEVRTKEVENAGEAIDETAAELEEAVVELSAALLAAGGTPGVGACGDGVCQIGETLSTCPQDCTTQCPGGACFCGDAVCQASESSATCPADCYVPSTGACNPVTMACLLARTQGADLAVQRFTAQITSLSTAMEVAEARFETALNNAAATESVADLERATNDALLAIREGSAAAGAGDAIAKELAIVFDAVEKAIPRVSAANLAQSEGLYCQAAEAEATSESADAALGGAEEGLVAMTELLEEDAASLAADMPAATPQEQQRLNTLQTTIDKEVAAAGTVTDAIASAEEAIELQEENILGALEEDFAAAIEDAGGNTECLGSPPPPVTPFCGDGICQPAFENLTCIDCASDAPVDNPMARILKAVQGADAVVRTKTSVVAQAATAIETAEQAFVDAVALAEDTERLDALQQAVDDAMIDIVQARSAADAGEAIADQLELMARNLGDAVALVSNATASMAQQLVDAANDADELAAAADAAIGDANGALAEMDEPFESAIALAEDLGAANLATSLESEMDLLLNEDTGVVSRLDQTMVDIETAEEDVAAAVADLEDALSEL